MKKVTKEKIVSTAKWLLLFYTVLLASQLWILADLLHLDRELWQISLPLLIILLCLGGIYQAGRLLLDKAYLRYYYIRVSDERNITIAYTAYAWTAIIVFAIYIGTAGFILGWLLGDNSSSQVIGLTFAGFSGFALLVCSIYWLIKLILLRKM